MLRHRPVAAALALAAFGSAGAGGPHPPTAAAAVAPFLHAAPLQAQQAPPPDAPLTRDDILKQGPAALEANCQKCHGPDKWESTSLDHDGWAAIVAAMQQQMAQAQMPPMNDRTTRIIIEYLTLTHPQ